MATKAAAGSADGNILKQTQVAFGDSGAAVASYKAFDAAYKSTSKPGMDFLGAQVAQQQGTFNSLMENKPPLESVPLLEDTQLAGNENVVGMEGLMKEVSGLYQEQARILSKNKGDLGAQKKITEAAGYIQNVDAGNKQLAQLKMGNFEIDGQYNDMLNPTQKGHLQGIHLAINGQDQTGIKIEYPKEDGYRLKVTMPDGTIYDKNNPLPTPQGEYKNGGTAAYEFYNDKREAGVGATKPLTKEGAASEFLSKINSLKSDSDSDKLATTNEKMSMFFTDIVDDGQDLTFANAFASGNLPKEFYMDDTGEYITFDTKTDDARNPSTTPLTEGQATSGPTVDRLLAPAFDENGNFNWSKEEATNYLRQKRFANQNIKRMSKWYGSAVSETYNSQFNVKKDMKGEYLKLPDGKGGFTDVYDDQAKKQKLPLYFDMVSKNVMQNSGNMEASLDKYETLFGSAYGIEIGTLQEGSDKEIAESRKKGEVNVIIGKEEKEFILSEPGQLEAFNRFLATSPYYKNLGLGGNPEEWEMPGGGGFEMSDMFNYDPIAINNNSQSSVTNNNRQGIRSQVDRTMPAPKI